MPEPSKHPRFHLAQYNIARARYDLDDARMAPFMDGLDRVNLLAERMEGFVWRYQDAGGNSTSVRLYDDPNFLLNYSVWENIECLKNFVFNSLHKRFLTQGKEWFTLDEAPYLVLWRVPAGQIPTVEEARDRLNHLRAHGPGPGGVGWDSIHLLPDAV